MSQQASPPRKAAVVSSEKVAVVSSEKVVVGSSRKTERIENDVDVSKRLRQRAKTSASYIDLDTIQKSTRFVIDRLFNTPDYNFFGDKEQEEELNNSWSQFIETLPKETDAASKLKRNRMKMAFVAANYHVISSKNPSSKLDRDYVASLQYRKDLNSIYSFSNLGTSELLDEVNMTAGKQLLKNSKKKKRFETMVLNLFKTAIILQLPVPLLEASENDQNVSASASIRSISKYTNKATIFNTHFQINPSPMENFDEEFINGIFRNLIIDFQFLLEVIPMMQSFVGQVNSINEAKVSKIMDMHILSPLTSLVPSEVPDPEYDIFSKVRSGIVLSIEKDDSRFQVPVVFKPNGILIAFQQRNDEENNTTFLDLFNQVVYQMITFKSRLGFAIDSNCVLIIEIDKDAKYTRETNIDGAVYQLKCHMECFNLFDSQYNVKAFMVALCKQYFSSVSGNDEGKLEELFETLEINDLDKKRNREWQVGFVRQEWESNFSNYSLQGEELYMHNEYRDLHIPKDCYEARENLKSSWSELNEKDFKIYWSNINLKVREEKEHFQFWGVECASENVNIDSNKRLVLKLYNPSRSPSRGMLTRRAFLNVYEYILSKFLLEVNAYRALRVGDSDERNLRRVEKNYIPRLYQFGYCEWQEVTQFQGFYLLIEYKDNDTLSLSAPDLFKKSSEFLGKIHVEKFFYSQKDEDAYTIDFGLPSPTRLKDFNSNKIEQDQDVIRLYKACEVEQLAPDVILGGRYSMMPKSKRQRTS